MPSRDHIPALDGLRGVAILLVMWGHLKATANFPAAPVGSEVFGVALFFALSGFLITRILLTEKADGLSPLGFWIRRAARIFPAYYLMLGVALLWLGPNDDILHAATYTQNIFGDIYSPISHTWSLSVEEHYYLVWPFAVAFLPVAASKRVAAFLAAFALVGSGAVEVGSMILDGKPNDQMLRWTCFVMLPIVLGSLSAYYEENLRSSVTGWWLGLGLIALAPMIHVLIGAGGMELGLLLHSTAQRAAHAMAAMGILLVTISGQSSLVSDCLRLPWLRYVGRISYGLYLYHFPLYCFFGVPTGTNRFVPVVLCVGLSFALAVLSYHYFERPIMDRVRAMQSRSNNFDHVLRRRRGRVYPTGAFAADGPP